MDSVIARLTWYFIHLIANVIEAIFYFGLEFRENIHNFVKNISSGRPARTLASDICEIERSIQELEKIPKHIIVIINNERKEDVDLSNLTSLIFWAMHSGVHFISFYDCRGIIKYELSHALHQLVQEKLTSKGDDNIVWGPDFTDNNYTRFPHRNGYKKHIIINLYSSEDSFGMFKKLLRNSPCDDKPLTSENVTIDKVDRKLSDLFGNIPDPELAVYFGNFTCTSGLFPWQIRLTEFIPISFKQQHLSLDKYLRVLYKYAKCEQRLGK